MLKTYTYHKLYEIFIAFTAIYLVFFYDVLSEFLGFFDEFVALIFLIFSLKIVLFTKQITLYKNEKYIFVLLVVLGVLGLLSNWVSYLHGYKTDINAIIGDFINVYKAFIVYFGIRLLSSEFKASKIIAHIAKYSKWLFVLVVLILFLDIALHIFPTNSRYGLRTRELFFHHPSRYSFAFAFTFLILYYQYIKTAKWVLLVILLIGLTSLRVKYFGFVFIAYFLLYHRDLLYKISLKLVFVLIGVAFLIMSVLFKDQLSLYFSLSQIRTGWSRGIILITSFDIGNDFFPLGTGFGTYSSYFSGKYYSWVYDKYHISNVWGISRSFWSFIADQFWPMVLGQFGYFGLLAYFAIVYQYIVLFLKLLKNKAKKNSIFMFVALLGMLLLLIDSSSDAIFTQNRAVVLFMLFALFINLQTENSEIEQ